MGNPIWPLVAKINKRIDRENITLAEAYGMLHPQLVNAPPSVLLDWLVSNSPAPVYGEAMRVLARRVLRRDDPDTAKRKRYPVMRTKRVPTNDGRFWDYTLHPTKGWRRELSAA